MQEEFQIPPQFIKKLHNFTGKADSYKGFLLFMVDANGNPRSILPLGMDLATQLLLRKAAEIWLESLNNQDSMSFEMPDHE